MHRISTQRLSLDELKSVKLLLQDTGYIDVEAAGFDVFDITIGTVNANFRVTDGEQSVLLKRFQQSKGLSISRQQVFALQQELAALNLSPQPLLLSTDEKFYIEEWMVGLTCYKQAINLNSLKVLADSLYNIHNAFILGPSLHLSEHWRQYLNEIADASSDIWAEQESLSAQLENYVNENKPDFVLCHNDLHISHICTQSSKIIDWEYAAFGCRYYDIASCININGLNKSDADLLCAEYAILYNQPPDQIIQRVQSMSKYVEFTNRLWFSAFGLNSVDRDTNIK